MVGSRIVLLGALLLINRSAFTEDIKDLTLDQLSQLAEDVSQARTVDITDDDVKYFLFTRKCPYSIRIKDSEAQINKTKPTKFIIHGWIATSRRSWTKRMTIEFLKNDDFNVIQVDWERIARTSYTSAVKDTKEIGHMIAQFIINLELPVDEIHLIGHSLGAHIAGFAAKNIMEDVGEKVGRISGLDPAGPIFARYASVSQERLDKNDAVVVDVIHTDPGGSGIAYPIGTLDIFVNPGLARQPGCAVNVDVTSIAGFLEHCSYCSHEMSITYFTEWINNGKFHCLLCSSWQNSLEGGCGKYVRIGEMEVDQTVTGICLAKASRHKPYLRS